MKIIRILTFLLCVISLFSVAYASGEENAKAKPKADSIETLTATRDKYLKEARMKEEEFTKKAYDLEEMVKKLEEANERLKGINGLGKIEQLEFKANLYSVEKQNSRAVSKKIAELVEAIKSWDDTKKKVENCEDKLKLAKEIQALKTMEVAVASVNHSEYKKNEIKFYTVRKAATLSEISGLDEVYANSDRKHYMELLKANPGVVKDPLKDIISVGVTLKVPDLQKINDRKKKDDFDNF